MSQEKEVNNLSIVELCGLFTGDESVQPDLEALRAAVEHSSGKKNMQEQAIFLIEGIFINDRLNKFYK